VSEPWSLEVSGCSFETATERRTGLTLIFHDEGITELDAQGHAFEQRWSSLGRITVRPRGRSATSTVAVEVFVHGRWGRWLLPAAQATDLAEQLAAARSGP